MLPVERLKDLFENTNMRTVEICEVLRREFSLSHSQSKDLLLITYSNSIRKARGSKLRSTLLTGTKLGEEHHNWKGGSRIDSGYVICTKPIWYTGKAPNGEVALHILTYCENHGLTEIPKGYDVHHKDFDKLNNAPENLELLTRSEHMRLHRLKSKGGI